jgi:hypothetical protein
VDVWVYQREVVAWVLWNTAAYRFYKRKEARPQHSVMVSIYHHAVINQSVLKPTSHHPSQLPSQSSKNTNSTSPFIFIVYAHIYLSIHNISPLSHPKHEREQYQLQIHSSLLTPLPLSTRSFPHVFPHSYQTYTFVPIPIPSIAKRRIIKQTQTGKTKKFVFIQHVCSNRESSLQRKKKEYAYTYKSPDKIYGPVQSGPRITTNTRKG